MNKILIINTGGTISKYPNNTFDELLVNNELLSKKILNDINITDRSDILIENIINKDSLNINKEDKQEILSLCLNYFTEYEVSKFIIFHGTDTMKDTAQFLNNYFKQYFNNKIQIVLLGSMTPFSIDKSEASFNFGVGYSFLKYKNKKGIFISMNGYLEKWNHLYKDVDNLIFKKIADKEKLVINKLEEFTDIKEQIRKENGTKEYSKEIIKNKIKFIKNTDKNEIIFIDNYFCPDCKSKIKTTRKFSLYECSNCEKKSINISDFIEAKKI